MKNLNLLFLCYNYYSSGELYLGKIEEEIILNDIHYKYNFRIQPVENNEVIDIYSSGTRINLIYPEILNFTSEEVITIKYLMESPYYSDIKLNLNSSELQCEDKGQMKKCIVSLSHFKNQESGTYYTLHLNHLKEYSPYYEIPPFEVILPPFENIIEIPIEDEYDHYTKRIGKNGTLYLTTSYNDTENIFNDSDIEEVTKFETTITDDKGNKHEAFCRLWKPINSLLKLFCDLNDMLPLGSTKIYLDSASFEYKGNKVLIISYINYIYVTQYDKDIPFLYSERQTIKIDEENDDLYEVKFNIGKYNNEKLFLIGTTFNILPLDDCLIENKELICKLKKDKLIEKTFDISQEFGLITFVDSLGMIEVRSVETICVEQKEPIKENIYIGITKLLGNAYTRRQIIAYETDVTSLPNLISNSFRDIKINNTEMYCVLKKTEEKPLLLLCMADYPGTFFLGEIQQEIPLNGIHLRYNFIISPVSNYEEFTIYESDKGAVIPFSYPEILDFNHNNNIIVDFYVGGESEYINGLKLNPDSPDELECRKDVNLVECVVPKSHFKTNSSGYYYTYYLNYLNESSADYLNSPIKVILPEDNEIIIGIKQEDNDFERIIGTNGITFFVTDYLDELNIFNISEIEEKSTFETKIIDDSNITYDATCRLWKPKDDTLSIFCTLKDQLNNGTKFISIEKVTFEYNNEYNISIVPEELKIEVVQVDGNVPFLYSDEQEIFVKNDITYELRFKHNDYNNELLELYDSNLNEKIIDNCQAQDKEVICTITKSEIEKILSHSEEHFNIGVLVDNFGVIYPETIMAIKFIHLNVTKEDIYVDIVKLQEIIIESNHYITYETNINSINDLITEVFYLEFTNSYEAACFFKKSESTKLLLLCRFNEEGEFSLVPTTEVIDITSQHILYNFYINPITNNETFTVTEDYGNYMYNSYPQILDFTKDNSINIYLLTGTSDMDELKEQIKLNPNGDFLKCEGLNYLIKCNVSIDHFEDEQSGYFNLYYINAKKTLAKFYEVTPFHVILPKRNILKISIKEEDNKETINVGQKGIVYFVTNYNDYGKDIFDPSDIEVKTSFETTMTDELANVYNAKCRLWDPINKKLVIICALEKDFLNDTTHLTLSESRISYNDYIIIINSNTSIKIEKVEQNIPFIYSDNQVINMNDEKEIYEFKFKYDTYNEEVLYLYGSQFDYTVLESCSKGEKEIICQISKTKLEEILSYSNETFYINAINSDIGIISFNLVYEINIIYEISEKINIYININKLLSNVTEVETAFAYEITTNIDSIPNLNTVQFFLYFNKGLIGCYFKKSNMGNLLLLCIPSEEGDIYLEKSDNNTVLDTIHYKYNFIIEPYDSKEIISVKDKGTLIELIYPESLNFTDEETKTISFITAIPENVKNIKLNPDSETYLECKDLVGMKICTVPKSHFEDKEPGYYYTHHLNHLNGYSIYYESNPINVKYPWMPKLEIKIEDKDNTNLIKIGQNGTIYLVTNYDDTSANIFNPTDLDTLSLDGIFSDQARKIYKSKCKLWKPNNDKMRLICRLEENLRGNEEKNIYLQSIYFIYKNNYNVTINYEAKNIKVKQLNIQLSFLYSDKQTVDLETQNANSLRFKQDFYDNRPLYLYKDEMRAVELKCESEDKELRCTIPPKEMLEILSKDGEIYSLAEKIDEEGLYIFNSVSDIIINYQTDRNNIYIKIEKLLTPIVSKNEFIAYETNITDLSSLTTDYFELKDNIKCIFKKNEKMNLLLLCNAATDGKNRLDNIDSKTLDKINILNTFIIVAGENREEFNVYSEGTKISSVSPLVLNFTKDNSYLIRYETKYPGRLSGIKLNEKAKSDLKCEDKILYKECNVTADHFDTSGDYHTYHTNHEGTKTISYEAPLINVIIKTNPSPSDGDSGDDNLGVIIGCSIAGAVVLIVILFLLWYFLCYKKKKIEKDSRDLTEDSDHNCENNDELKQPMNSQVQEEIKQSEANEDRINA